MKRLFILLGLLIMGPGARLDGQVNPGGRIQSQGWLALGPFTNPFGCTGIDEYFLTLHLAPSSIHAMTPEEGDTVEYDPALASTQRYSGPRSDGKPVWRPFDDGTGDEDLNFEADAARVGGETEAGVTYVVTYFEYIGAGPIDLDLCVGNEDGVQVWIDKELAFNWNGCRDPRGECDETVPATIRPGLHRIAMGIWEHGGGWGGSFGFKKDGVYITDDHPDWVFFGVERSGLTLPNEGVFVREIDQPSDPDACPPQTGGPLDVMIRADLVPGGPIPLVEDEVRGSFGPAQVTVEEGGIATAIPQDPVRPAGMFADARTVLVRPICPDGNGDVIHDDGGTPGDPSDDSYTVSNVGEDIWVIGDSFTFAYSKVVGDFVFTAHVAERSEAPGRWGKHGVMARQDVTTRSRYSFQHDQQDPVSHGDDDLDQTRWSSRPTHGGSDDYETVVLAPSEHHDWLRIERTGGILKGYSSADGTEGSWILHGTEDWGPSAPAAILVGLAVTSHAMDCSFPLTIEFDHVDLLLGPGASLVAFDSPDPIGVKVTWRDVPREALAGGLRYTVDVDSGVVAPEGSGADDIILGEGHADVGKRLEDFGPFTDPDFSHAHNVGAFFSCRDSSATRPAPGVFTVAGAGWDGWIDGDQFTFAYTQVAGDFSARVTVTDRSFAPGSRWGRYGIMARQDCSSRSRYSFIQDQGEDLQDSVRYSARPTHGGQDNFSLVPPESSLHADTLRLDRCGNTFIGYVLDVDGTFGGLPGSWVELGRNEWAVDPPDSVSLGLAVSSGAGCSVAEITFEDWQLEVGCGSGVEDLSCTLGEGGLDLSWRNPSGADPAVPISIQVDGQELFTVPGTATAAMIPLGNLPDDRIATIGIVNSGGIAAACSYPAEYSPEGFIKTWLLLGPYLQSAGCSPGEEAIRLDYLADGKGIGEASVRPRAGDGVETDFEGAAASLGLATTPFKPGLNPGGVPTWAKHSDGDDTIVFDEHYGSSSVNNVVMYAAAYLEIELPMTVDIGLASDDAVQVLLDGAEIHLNSACRGDGGRNVVLDTIPGIALDAGVHLLIVKVFDGLFVHSFRLRFQDEEGRPIWQGIKVSLEPPGGETPAFRRGDADANGAVNLTDAIRILNVLFLGIGAISCEDAADADDNGAVNLTDAIRVLNVLFLGLGSIPPPGSEGCGIDPVEDGLSACSYASCPSSVNP